MRDSAYLTARLAGLRRAIDTDYSSRTVLSSEAREHPCLGAARDRAHDDRVEEQSDLMFLLLYLQGPLSEANSTKPMVGRSCRNAIRLTTRGLDLAECLLPARLEANAEPFFHEPHVGSQDPAEEDVADLVVHRIGPIDPALLDQYTFHSQSSRNGGDLARVIRLNPTDGKPSVATLSQRGSKQILNVTSRVAARS